MRRLLKNFATLGLTLALLLTCAGAFAAERPPVKAKVWNKVFPYLLPDDHPIKPNLDLIFSSSRAILNLKTLRAAGFVNPKVRKWTRLIVVKHPQLPGYVVKTYLDAQRNYKDKPEYHHWLLRIKGARAIQDLIDKNQWNHLFKVPKKWIYALPNQPAPPKEYSRKNFILVQDDMDLLSPADNRAAWGSHMVTEEMLFGLYTILETLGLTDCIKIDNIPFSKDGRVAFIDTQSFDQWPVHYKMFTSFLSEDLQPYWKRLIRNGL